MISIIMATLNSEAFVGEALDSVARQKYAGEIEVIIADGGSSDNTRKIASKYAFVRVLEGADNGIYEGFNRGIDAANGDVIGFLNADDWLTKDALEQVNLALNGPITEGNTTLPEFVSGGISYGDPDVNSEPSYHGRQMTIAGLMFGIPAINARFFTRECIEKTGMFVQDIGLAADREYLLRMYNKGIRGENIRQVLYHYRIHKGSSTIARDGDARSRVWGAELQLASYLLGVAGQEDNIRRIARQSVALVKMKMWVARVRNVPVVSAGVDRGINALAFDWWAAPRALRNWKNWRGKLSGW